MEKLLRLYTIKDGNVSAFPNEEHQIILTGFNYDAKRMGGAPIISSTVMYPTCLDNQWNEDVFVEFNGEKYFLKQTPTSSKSNTEARYKHECEFVSERIALDNVYFIDAVVGDPQDNEKPVSNSATFSFFGTIAEFAKRLNVSLRYSKLQKVNEDGTIDGYYVEIGNLVDLEGKPYDNEEKLLSFDKVSFSVAIQESYNQFGVPYYFDGKRIVFDYFQHAIKDTTFKYGSDNELLSITKTNANQKLVNRCTGTGSSENIPYYYPNSHPQGELKPLYNRNNSIVNGVVSIDNDALFAKNILLSDNIEYTSYIRTIIDGLSIEFYEIKNYKEYCNTVPNQGLIKGGTVNGSNWFLAPKTKWTDSQKENYSTSLFGSYNIYDDNVEHTTFSKYNNALALRITVDEGYFLSGGTTDEIEGKTFRVTLSDMLINTRVKAYIRSGEGTAAQELKDYEFKFISSTPSSDEKQKENVFEFAFLESFFKKDVTVGRYDDNDYDKSIYIVLSLSSYRQDDAWTIKPKIKIEYAYPKAIRTWQNSRGNRRAELGDWGLKSTTTPNLGDIITFEQISYVQPMPSLMPPIYWSSNGTERYYNAENSTYKDENGNYYTFHNPYKDSKRKEHIVDFPDIKPSIENVYDKEGNPINSFIGFAYDKEDNDQVDENGNYLHPYFYGKLQKMPFNLFTHASEKGDATFSMTSGKCGACNFVLGVNSESLKNPVQVDDNGEIKRYEDGTNKGNVMWGIPQDKQNDTVDNEVWVALKKDASTYGVIMPNAQNKYRPESGDTFVLTNIKFPIEYVLAAEERLKDEIIKFMYENNMEKFTFSIKFSRIYLEEHKEDVLKLLNENALINIEYNGEEKTLYVSSFAYKKDANTALPEITVELADTLSASHNALQTAISEVKTDVLDRVQKMDIAAMVAAKFISKDTEDYARQKITFNRGLAFGDKDADNGKIDELGNSELLTLVLKQYISSPQFVDGFAGSGYRMWLDELGLSHLTIDNLTVRQKMTIFELLISKARAVNGGLWVSAANGKISKVVERENDYEITLEDDNMFVDGDYIRCQVFSDGEQRFYWVEVSSVDGGRLYVAKSDFGDSAPLVGDDIILDGSRNINRQNAIHISASEDGQPRIAIYNGISTKSHEGCLRTQLGDLNNIQDKVLNPHGDGLYSDNAYLKGEFVLRSGKSIDTMFSVTDGKIQASVEQTQKEAIKGKTLLYNASFTKGFEGWLTSDESSMYWNNGSLLTNNNSVLTKTVTISGKPIYDNVFFATIDNGWIKQPSTFYVDKPNFEEGKKYPLVFSANVRCEKSGVLNVQIVGGDATNAKSFKGISSGDYFEDFVTIAVNDIEAHTFSLIEGAFLDKGDEFLLDLSGKTPRLFNTSKGVELLYNDWREEQVIGEEEQATTPAILVYSGVIEKHNDFKSIDVEDLSWNGSGDFYLSFTGKADFYGLTIYTEKTEVRHKAIFDVEAGLSQFAQQNIDNTTGEIRQESGIMIKPEGTDIYVFDGDKKAYVTLGKFYTDENGKKKIELTGDDIILSGDISANGNVRIDAETGTLTATNAEFTGNISAGSIGDFKINRTLSSENKQGKSIIIHPSGVSIYTEDGYAQLATPICIDTPNATELSNCIYINTKEEANAINVKSGLSKFDGGVEVNNGISIVGNINIDDKKLVQKTKRIIVGVDPDTGYVYEDINYITLE